MVWPGLATVMGHPLLGASVSVGWASVCLVPGEGLEPARLLDQPQQVGV